MAKKTKKAASQGQTSKIRFQPLLDRVLIKPVSAEERTASGLIIPDTARKEKPEQGTVVAVGPGKRGDDNDLIPVSVKIGDRVMFSGYGNDEIQINDVDYLVVPETNIVGVFK